MTHPVCWPSRPEFHPMGMNEATSLTKDLAPEQAADILLLDCGDPSDILYTVSADVTCNSAPRKLDITCCDCEPAILARNIIFFTLLEEDTPSNHLWDIFYHPKLSEHAFGLVTSHSRKLADLAETPETWRQSKYGAFIKMTDASSLSELRRLWTSYAEFPNLPSERLEKLQKEHATMAKLKSTQAKTGLNPVFSRSAAGAWREAMVPVNEQFGHYWEHGTTATTNKEIKKTTKLNPTFCYSVLGETFAIYQESFPVTYHFAPAFTPLVSDPVGPATSSAMIKAKQQFKAGCVALQASRKAQSIILRFFVGDSLAICRAFDLYNKTKDPKTEEFTAPWRSTPIDLTEHSTASPPAPNSFDVIHTFLLVTHVGLANVLLAGQPLLKKRPASQAVLYTDIPLQTGGSVELFIERLCGSVPAIGVLIGLVPRPYVSVFTSLSNTHELLLGGGVPIYMERIPWVDPASGDRHTHTEPSPVVCFGCSDLAEIMFMVYRKMVTFDTMPVSYMRTLAQEEMRHYSAPHYTREAVAMLFAHVKSRVQLVDEDWSKTASKLIGMIALHDTQCGLMNYFHELQNSFRLLGLPFLKSDQGFEDDVCKTDIFKDWTDVPRMVCVVLIVPSKKLDPIRKDTMVPSPRLVCNFGSASNKTMLTHSAIQTVWGKCIPLEGSDGKYVIEEDPEGSYGKSDLVVSFWANAETMTPAGMTISLTLRRTPLVLAQYHRVLGPELNLYTTQGTDKDHVLILRERPMGMSQTQKPYRYPVPALPEIQGIKCQIKIEHPDNNSFEVESMVAKLTLESPSDRAELSKVDKVTCTQVGPCTMKVSFASAAHILRFPYPIRGPDKSINVDWFEHRIEVTLPFFKPIATGGYPTDVSPVINHTTPSPWNIHHINMDRMPMIDVQQREKLRRWLMEHTTVQFSDRERVTQRSTHATQRRPSEVLVNLKESLSVLVQDYVGIREGPQATFGLIEPSFGIFVVVFVAGLRLDLVGATVALDCAVVSMSLESAALLQPGQQHLDKLTRTMQVRTRPAEVAAWKHLMPAFVERCRTWPHKNNCRYKSTGKIPLSEDIEVDPLCKCGQGIGFDGPEWKVSAWEKLLPYATRAAISPLFGVSYLEVVVGPSAMMADTRRSIAYTQPTDVCWRCGGLGRPLLRCQKCKKALYCSKECQRLHWKEEHKQTCAGA